MKNILKNIIAAILRFEARLVLKRYKPKIITITGSVGKTSTKDAVYAVLSNFYHVRKSEKSFNSEIGLPLTILGLPNAWDNPLIWIKNIIKGLLVSVVPQKYPEWLVLEVGVGAPGDMRRTASWLYSDIVVVTRFGTTPVHIEFFKSLDHLIAEKAELLKTLKTAGTLVLNADDQAVLDLKHKTKNKVLTFGFNADAAVVASNEVIQYGAKTGIVMPQGITFRVNFDGNSVPVVINGVFGKNHIYAAIVALSVAHELSLDMLKAADGLKNCAHPPGRMRILEGIKNSLIIDDTYNSSPIAAEAALRTLEMLETSGRRIALLGDMLELGKHTEEAHRQIGKIVSEAADILVTVGRRTQLIVDGAMAAGMSEKKIFQFEDARAAGKYIEEILRDGDIILIKGSQGMRMERAVEEVMAHPELKDRLLVRQEPEWIVKG